MKAFDNNIHSGGQKVKLDSSQKYILFLDESGNDNLSSKYDTRYPLFGIGGVIFDETTYFATEDKKIRDFKMEVFGSEDVILHSYDIRKKQKSFTCLHEKEKLEIFKYGYDNLMTNLDCSFVSRIIDKEAHKAKYKNPFNPYSFGLELLMESFSKILLRKKAVGRIVLESRLKTHDKLIRAAFDYIMGNGTFFVSKEQLRATIMGLEFRSKKDNVNGLQISDLSIYTVTSAVIHNNFRRRDFVVLQPKFDPYHGLKRFPNK